MSIPLQGLGVISGTRAASKSFDSWIGFGEEKLTCPMVQLVGLRMWLQTFTTWYHQDLLAVMPCVQLSIVKLSHIPRASPVPEISFAKALMVAEKHCRLGVRPERWTLSVSWLAILSPDTQPLKSKWNIIVDFFSWTCGEMMRNSISKGGGWTIQEKKHDWSTNHWPLLISSPRHSKHPQESPWLVS